MPEAGIALAFLIVAAALAGVAIRLEMALRQIRELRDRVRMLEGGGSVPVTAAAPGVIPGQVAPAPRAPTPPPPRPRQDWETVVGANWLNRLGALMLVIGIALFVGYSLTQLGPGGKIAIGTVLGLGLLGGGVVLEPRPTWRTYAWSLMAAGWAILYFTAYAAHAVPAARVLADPAAATVVLLLVSAAMIGHSLRYRSEPATALAYLLGFVGLNVSAVTPFSVVASLILALSLIGLAWRFGWFRLPLLGSVLVYLTFVVRYNPSVHSEALLWVYWIAFEVWDLLRGRRREFFLVNFAGFAGASLLNGMQSHLADWFPFCAAAAVAYLASAAVRYRADVARDEGGYEWAAAAAAVFFGGGLVGRFTGPTLTLALLFEAELVVLAGRALGSRWLENAGSVGLTAPLVHLLFDLGPGSRWTRPATAISAVLLLNRWLLSRGWYFTGLAAVLMASVGWEVLPSEWRAPAVAVAGALAFRVPLRDFHWTGVFLLAAGWLGALVNNVLPLDTAGTAVVLAALYSALWQPPQIAATVLLTVFLLFKAPSQLVTVAWGIEATALLAAGFPLGDRTLRLSALAVFLLCLLRLFAFDLRGLDTPSRILSFVVLGVVLLGASFVYTRARRT